MGMSLADGCSSRSACSATDSTGPRRCLGRCLAHRRRPGRCRALGEGAGLHCADWQADQGLLPLR